MTLPAQLILPPGARPADAADWARRSTPSRGRDMRLARSVARLASDAHEALRRYPTRLGKHGRMAGEAALGERALVAETERVCVGSLLSGRDEAFVPLRQVAHSQLTQRMRAFH